MDVKTYLFIHKLSGIVFLFRVQTGDKIFVLRYISFTAVNVNVKFFSLISKHCVPYFFFSRSKHHGTTFYINKLIHIIKKRGSKTIDTIFSTFYIKNNN